MSQLIDSIEITGISDSTDSSKKLVFNFSSGGVGSSSILDFSNLTSDRSYVLDYGNIIIDTLSGTLTNKTITDDSNVVYVKGLKTTGSTVLTSSSVNPVLGNCFTAASPTSIVWKTIGLGNAMTSRGDMVYQDSNNQTSRLPIGSQSQYLMVTSGSAPNDVNYNNYYVPLRSFQFYDDFIGGAVGNKNWIQQSSSGTYSIGPPGVSGNSIGTINMSCTAVGSNIALSTSSLPIGAGPVTYEIGVYFANLSDGTNTYIFRGGLGDVGGGADFGNGIYFEYNIASGTGTGLTWLCKTNTGGGIPTVYDSLVTVAATVWYQLTAVINASGTSVDYYINRVFITTIAQTIPTRTSCYLSFNKTAGTTVRAVTVDYYVINCQLDSNRY